MNGAIQAAIGDGVARALPPESQAKGPRAPRCLTHGRHDHFCKIAIDLRGMVGGWQ